MFGYNIWSDFHPILGKDVLDSEDFLVSNLLLPIGSLVYLLFCVTKWGWGFDKYLAEVNKGAGIKLLAQAQALFPVGAADPDRHHPAPRPAVNLLFSHLSYAFKEKPQ